MEQGQTVADRYELGPVIGRGGMAVVHRATDRRLGREVAVKVFQGAEAADRQRFAGEMRLLAGLRHPSLLGLYDGGEEDGTPYLVLELADGPTLADTLAVGPMPAEDVEVLVRDLSAGLDHIHQQGIVHRDLKPSNVLRTPDGRAVLGDFGIARLVDATRLTATGTAIGTPAYLAPEQLRGQDVTPKADVYALGLLALEALTGARAFGGTRDEAALARLATDPPVDAVADPRWRELLGRMTARSPDERPTAAEVHDALASATALTEPIAVEPTMVAPVPTPGRSVPRRSVPGWAIAAAIVFVVALAVTMATRSGGDDALDADAAAATTAPPPTTTATTVPATVPATTPVTAAPTTTPPSPCADLQAQRDQVEEAKRALHDQHDLDPDERHDQEEALKDQKRQLDEALRANGC